MSATQDQVYRLIDRTLGRLDDFFDCWMAAPNNENDPVGRVDRQRDFLHFQVDAPSAIQQDEVEAWRDFGRLRDPGEIPFGPGGAKPKRFGGPAVEIPHIRRKRLVTPVEGAWQSRTEHTEIFLRRID